MKRIEAGTNVACGYYWNTSKFEITHIKPEGGALEGKAGETFVKLPFPLLLVAAPLMGLTFVMFLPFIGFALVVGLAAKRVAQLFTRSTAELAAAVQPGWRPGEAYLAGKRPDEAGEPKKDEALEKLAEEIDSKRKG